MKKLKLITLQNQMLGKEPILHAIRQNAASEAAQIIDAIFETLRKFIGEVKIEDGMTSVVKNWEIDPASCKMEFFPECTDNNTDPRIHFSRNMLPDHGSTKSQPSTW